MEVILEAMLMGLFLFASVLWKVMLPLWLLFTVCELKDEVKKLKAANTKVYEFGPKEPSCIWDGPLDKEKACD